MLAQRSSIQPTTCSSVLPAPGSSGSSTYGSHRRSSRPYWTRELQDFFARHREFALLYRKRLLCTALAGDAALHYLNGATCLEEFDVWWLFAEHAEAPFPFHMVDHADFGESKFGRAPQAPTGYVGRRVSLQGRSIDARPDEEPLRALQR